MFFKKFTWSWRKKTIFSLLCLFLLVTLLLTFTRIFEPENVRLLMINLSNELKISVNNRCIRHQCTLEQSQEHGDIFASFKHDWSGCYADFYLMAFDNYDASVYTLLDVGANKAYAVATWFSFFLPTLGINQASLYNYLQTTQKLTEVCGSCNDCKDEPLKRKYPQQNITLHIHAFEPQPDTVDILKGVQRWMNISERSKSTFNIHGKAVSNHNGQTLFRKCNPGNEVCSLDISQTSAAQQVSVDVITLDHFANKHNLAKIDILKIDTEGYEPFVFHGAKQLLQEHRIRLFIFEHLKRAAWKNTSLQIEVTKLAELGYVCYIIGKTGIILVTNCWHNKFDVPHGNLLCVSSRDTKLFSSIDRMKVQNTYSALCDKT